MHPVDAQRFTVILGALHDLEAVKLFFAVAGGDLR